MKFERSFVHKICVYSNNVVNLSLASFDCELWSSIWISHARGSAESQLELNTLRNAYTSTIFIRRHQWYTIFATIVRRKVTIKQSLKSTAHFDNDWTQFLVVVCPLVAYLMLSLSGFHAKNILSFCWRVSCVRQSFIWWMIKMVLWLLDCLKLVDLNHSVDSSRGTLC